MATLKHLESDSDHVLASRHVVGRASACQLRLTQPEVSGLHAELRWDGDRWIVQDLGSRNGTFVDGSRISAGERVPVRVGSQIAFGALDDRYRIVNVDPPRLMAVAADGRSVVAESALLSVPNDEAPELTVFEDAQGRWVIDTADGNHLLQEHEVVAVGGTSWTIFLPTASAHTIDTDGGPMPLGAVGLEFKVSRDQEYVAIRVTHDRGSVDLEPRAHAQLLLTLARIRLADREREHLTDSEHGWIHRDDLLKALSIDLQLLNLWVFRARQQLIKAGIRDAGNVVERRSGTLQLRIGVGRLTVDNA